MTCIEHITQAEAMRRLKITSKESFKKKAELYRFEVFAGLRGDEYDWEDIKKKYSTPKSKLIRA